MPIPLAVLGGHPLAEKIKTTPETTLADDGATIGALLGLRPVKRIEGKPLSPDSAGHSLITK
jgi:hypothetical protein